MATIRVQASDGVPLLPPPGYIRWYVDSNDGHTKQVDSAGIVLDLTVAAAVPVSDDGVVVVPNPNGLNFTGEGVTVIDNASSAEVRIPAPENKIVVNKPSEFPNQDANLIYLDPNVAHNMGNVAMSINKPFVVGENATMYRDTPNATGVLEYLGTDDMFTGVDCKWFTINNMSLYCPDAQCFNFSDTAPSTVFSTRTVQFRSNSPSTPAVNKIGTFTNVRGVLFEFGNASSSPGLGTNDGITIAGATLGLLSFDRWAMVSFSPTFIGLDLGTTIVTTAFNINAWVNVGLTAGSIGFKGLPNSGNINPGIRGFFDKCESIGPITPLVGISESDIRYQFRNSTPIPDSTITADTYLTTQEIVTITAQGVFVPIAGGNWASDILERFSVDADGILTFLAETSTKIKVTGSVSVSKVGGGANRIALGVSVNGAQPVIKTHGVTQVADPTNVSSQLVVTVNQNDTVQLYVVNLDAMANVIVEAGASMDIINGF